MKRIIYLPFLIIGETVDDNGLRAIWNLEDDAYGCSVATIPLQSDGVTAWCAGLIYAMTVENNS